MTWPPTDDEVMRELRITTLDADQASVLSDSLDAAVDYVQDNRPDLWVGDPPVFTAPPRVHRGAVRYAAAIYTRAINPGGIDPVTGIGSPPVYSLDVNVANLLGVRGSRKPAVG